MKKLLTLFKEKGIGTARPPLQVLKAAAGLTPIPALGTATDIIIFILDTAYQNQQNAGTCHEIANRIWKGFAQEFVKKYKSKKAICRLLYSKSDNDEMQRLGKRVDDTLMLFQITRSLSLEEVCDRSYASLQRIEQVVVELKDSISPFSRPEGASVDLVLRGDITLYEEITNGPRYSLQTVKMDGKAVAIKVFTGRKAKSGKSRHIFGMTYCSSPNPSIPYDTVPIETILASFQMEEVGFELTNHSSGIKPRQDRRDCIFSFIEKRNVAILPNRG
ncbi:hypothetical protein DFS33DRAFT_1378245 [Desarmillaria ectypa]|nr:hypothetical protein DFS33DRAFT_1378245 [Desarmillaria ectypa]